MEDKYPEYKKNTKEIQQEKKKAHSGSILK